MYFSNFGPPSSPSITVFHDALAILHTDLFVIFLCDFSVTGPTGSNPIYSDCSYAMGQLAYFCDTTGGLKTWNGYQYKLDPNDGGNC
jgi:hypothetical protein